MVLFVQVAKGHRIHENLIQVFDALLPYFFVEGNRHAMAHRPELLNSVGVLAEQKFRPASVFRFGRGISG